MSIDFTGVTGIEDDYGNVTKITDASGRVLWKSGPDMAKVTLLADTFEVYDYVSAYVEYKTPNGDYVSLYTAGEYELPIGTVMLFNLKYGGKDRVDMYITLNDESVASGDMDAFYEYTLAGNISIDFYNGYYNGGAIYITEE